MYIDIHNIRRRYIRPSFVKRADKRQTNNSLKYNVKKHSKFKHTFSTLYKKEVSQKVVNNDVYWCHNWRTLLNETWKWERRGWTVDWKCLVVAAAVQLRRDNRHVVGPCYDWDLEIGDQVSEHIKYELLFVVRNNVIKGLPSHHSRHHIWSIQTQLSCGTPHRSPSIIL